MLETTQPNGQQNQHKRTEEVRAGPADKPLAGEDTSSVEHACVLPGPCQRFVRGTGSGLFSALVLVVLAVWLYRFKPLKTIQPCRLCDTTSSGPAPGMPQAAQRSSVTRSTVSRSRPMQRFR